MTSDLPLNYDPVPYLEQINEPWIKYNIKRIQNKENSNEFKELIQNPRIQSLVDECINWPDPPLKRHNDAKHPIHKIGVLADLGLDIRDEWIKALTDLIIEHRSEDGFFLSNIEMPEKWGGRGTGELTWFLCDTPILIYSLQKFGINNEYIKEATRMLVWLAENNGWRCRGENQNFKGPGKKVDYCPYANLIALKALSLSDYRDTDAVRNGIDSHILQWENRNIGRIRMFGIGSTFKKLKYPNVWYDILHVVEVLSRYPYALEYQQFWEMWEIIKKKQTSGGGFVPESIWRAWSDWSFGQKKEPSPWMTLRILEIADRIKQYS
ncbi:hypothetical protein GF326_02260 [Candidatus Bathyarchaeota archaeon]|nr:hypothetical protein [Candidatus Bathyarchaeota archaeon]